MSKSVVQEWVSALPMMQQTVLLTAIRGPDGVSKHHPVKPLVRWYRRCVLYSAKEQVILENPFVTGGGDFCGPYTLSTAKSVYGESFGDLKDIIDKLKSFSNLRNFYLHFVDELPHHYQLHFMHSAQILGYKHPNKETNDWWLDFYLMLTDDMHVNPENKSQLDVRLKY